MNIIILLFPCFCLALGLAALFFSGQYFLKEFTKPGVHLTPDSSECGDWIFPRLDKEPPQEMRRTATLSLTGGVQLFGEFWAQRKPAPTIIISHGFHMPTAYFRGVAALIYEHGANVCAVDYRGHGKSSPHPTSCGNAEIEDLLAVVHFSASQPETLPGRVYVLGFSMGAAIALMLPPHPAVAGIIADSPYARLDEVIISLIAQTLDQKLKNWRGPLRALRLFSPLLSHSVLLSGRLLFWLRYRLPLVARPDQSILMSRSKHSFQQITPPPILLIHARHDPLVALHHAHRLVEVAQKAGRVIQAYFPACTIHCGSYGHNPQKYLQLLREFVAL